MRAYTYRIGSTVTWWISISVAIPEALARLVGPRPWPICDHRPSDSDALHYLAGG